MNRPECRICGKKQKSNKPREWWRLVTRLGDTWVCARCLNAVMEALAVFIERRGTIMAKKGRKSSTENPPRGLTAEEWATLTKKEKDMLTGGNVA